VVELRSDEHALYEGRPAWRALLSFYAGGVALAVLGGAIAGLAASPVAGVLVGVGIAALTLVVGWVRRFFTKYLITNQRLRVSRGFVRRRVQETRLERVQNVNYQQGVLDRVLNVGSVDFDTAGTDDSEFQFQWVRDPEHIVRAVDEAVAEAGGQPGIEPR
jgi:uncharacterized membrane protein YdbT with pleckstrin-like domain